MNTTPKQEHRRGKTYAKFQLKDVIMIRYCELVRYSAQDAELVHEDLEGRGYDLPHERISTSRDSGHTAQLSRRHSPRHLDTGTESMIILLPNRRPCSLLAPRSSASYDEAAVLDTGVRRKLAMHLISTFLNLRPGACGEVQLQPMLQHPFWVDTLSACSPNG